MVESTDGKSDNQVNSVLKKHYNQMTEVSEKMEAERDHQQQILQEKIQAKKQQKERCVCAEMFSLFKMYKASMVWNMCPL